MSLRDIAIISMQRACSCSRRRLCHATCSYSSTAPTSQSFLRQWATFKGSPSSSTGARTTMRAPVRRRRPCSCCGGTTPTHLCARSVPGAASFLERAQSIADSVTPSDVPAIDYAVCRARANALQYPALPRPPPPCPSLPPTDQWAALTPSHADRCRLQLVQGTAPHHTVLRALRTADRQEHAPHPVQRQGCDRRGGHPLPGGRGPHGAGPALLRVAARARHER